MTKEQKAVRRGFARGCTIENHWTFLMRDHEEYKRLSIVGRRVDALALGADERRDKLRKAAGSCT